MNIYKKLVLNLVIAVLFSGCTTSPTQPLTPEQAAEHRALYKAQQDEADSNLRRVSDNARAAAEWNRVQAQINSTAKWAAEVQKKQQQLDSWNSGQFPSK